MSNGFDAAMRRLEEVFAASKGGAPAGFEDLINYWHSAWGLSGAARRDLHLLRVWRNASDHHDAGEWQRKGPRSAEEALTVLERVERAAGALERRVDLDIYEFRPRDCIKMLVVNWLRPPTFYMNTPSYSALLVYSKCF